MSHFTEWITYFNMGDKELFEELKKHVENNIKPAKSRNFVLQHLKYAYGIEKPKLGYWEGLENELIKLIKIVESSDMPFLPKTFIIYLYFHKLVKLTSMDKIQLQDKYIDLF